jgi:hypothetical protein
MSPDRPATFVRTRRPPPSASCPVVTMRAESSCSGLDGSTSCRSGASCAPCHGRAAAGLPGDLGRRGRGDVRRRPALAARARCARRDRASVLAGSTLRVPRTAHSARHGPPTSGAHRRAGAPHQGVRLEAAAQRAARRRGLDAVGGRGPRRRHLQSAGPCCAQSDCLRRRAARSLAWIRRLLWESTATAQTKGAK